LPKGRSHFHEALPDILEDATLPFSGSFRSLLAQLKSELDQLTACVEEMDSVIERAASSSEVCQRLTTIPGIGPVTATALIRCYWQRQWISERTRPGGMGRNGSPRIFHRREAKTVGHQQTRQSLPAQAICARGTRCVAIPDQTGPRVEQLVRPTDRTQASTRRRRSIGE